MKRCAGSVFFLLLLCSPTIAQEAAPPSDADRITKLEREVQQLRSQLKETESSLTDYASDTQVTILYMFFCGAWAVSIGRRFWVWWFLGVFSVVTVFVLLYLTGQDWKKGRRDPASAWPKA